MNFKAGDIVVLKSGGPKMTIEKIVHKNEPNPEIVAHCIWFENEQVKGDAFSIDIISLYE